MCCYFIKQLLNGFRVFGWPDPNNWDVARVKKSLKTTRLRLVVRNARGTRVNSRNILAYLDQAIQTRKPLSNCLFINFQSLMGSKRDGVSAI